MENKEIPIGGDVQLKNDLKSIKFFLLQFVYLPNFVEYSTKKPSLYKTNKSSSNELKLMSTGVASQRGNVAMT